MSSTARRSTTRSRPATYRLGLIVVVASITLGAIPARDVVLTRFVMLEASTGSRHRRREYTRTTACQAGAVQADARRGCGNSDMASELPVRCHGGLV